MNVKEMTMEKAKGGKNNRMRAMRQRGTRGKRVRKAKERDTHNRLKRAFLFNNLDFFSKPGPILGNLLSSPNMTRHFSIDLKGVYQLNCSCNPESTYIGQTHVSCHTRMGQQHNDVTFSTGSSIATVYFRVLEKRIWFDFLFHITLSSVRVVFMAFISFYYNFMHFGLSQIHESKKNQIFSHQLFSVIRLKPLNITNFLHF